MRSRIPLLMAVVLVATVVGPALGASTPVGAQEDPIQCRFPFSTTDATGTEVTVENEPQSIVTLNPSAAQTMWEIGGREKVVGVSQFASYLEGAESKTNISAAGESSFNLERIVSLEPDLVLAPNTISNDTVAQLRETGLTVFKFPFQQSIEDIQERTLLMGQLTGECDGAEETVASMEKRLNTVQRAVEGEDRPRVLYVFFGYTAGEGTFAHRVIETAGGTNIAAEANISGYQQISQEVVVEYNPQWIVVNDGATGIPATEAYNNTNAVQNNQTVVLQEEYISQPAPRIVRSVVKLAQTLHPEAYEQATNATQTAVTANETQTTTTATPTETTSQSTTQTQTATAESSPATTTTSTPGFGLGIAATAIALSSLFFGRRSS